MKSRPQYIFLLLIFSLILPGHVFSLPNPSAVYAEKMGCEYIIERDAKGNEHGVCILPDGSKVSAWDFFKGKAGKKFSYCAKKGYSIETETTKKGDYTTECAICVKTDPESKKNIRIPMEALMLQNGEPLVSKKSKKTSYTPSIPPQLGELSIKSLPSSFDWRNFNGNNYVNPIRNQGSCGSCYAFAAVACAEGVYNAATNSYGDYRKSFSESFIMWCLGRLQEYNGHFYGCDGADWDYMELGALVSFGGCLRSSFPYTIVDPNSCTHWNDPRYQFSSWGRVACNDIEGIKAAIMTYGTVDAAVYVINNFNNYTNGIYSDDNTGCDEMNCAYTYTNHGIALVGWSHDQSGDYWILRNSWDTDWGESGYMRLRTTSARVACEVSYLIANPTTVRNAATISEGNLDLKSGCGIKFISGQQIDINSSFTIQRDASLDVSIQEDGGLP